ncbi:MAG: VCBS repeat-containing protein [Methylococcaceae bacterium]|nr:VCBS repeat-containing protein [Methylococcaceae bacterium]
MKRPLSKIILLLFTLTGVNVIALPIDDNNLPPELPNDQNGLGNEDEPPDEDPVDQRCAQYATGSVSASAAQVDLGQSVTLSWSVQLPAEYCQGAYVTLGNKPVAAEGVVPISPMSNGYYPLVVNGVKQVANVRIDVHLPATVYISGSTEDWAGLLIQAVGEENKTVILSANVDMNLMHSNIGIARGVTLTSEPPRALVPPGKINTILEQSSNVLSLNEATSSLKLNNLTSVSIPLKNLPDIVSRQSARDARHPGPRLYTHSRARPLFVIACKVDEAGDGHNVSINGFRLIGPDIDKPVGSDYKDRAIQINGCKNIEIANMELAGWSGQAIYVQDMKDLPAPGRLSEPSQVSIHDNFFHHNQQKTGGDGYGVEVKHGGYALMERNVFDFNRHAIAAGGEDGTGYTARHNLVLPGGGYHKWEDPLDGPLDINYSWHTHQFDVHGTDHCGLQSTFSDSLYNCGQAGEKFEMIQNAFQYTRGYAIKVRGIPTIAATINQNVFAHSSEEDAIHEYGIGAIKDLNNTTAFANQFGVQTDGKYGVCDFDGDKKDDLFLATGASWWMMSGAKQHWVFLNTSTERLEQLGLGDFDGDRRCDVFSVHANDFGIYKSGTGAWQSLGTFNVPMNQLRFADFNGDRVQDIFRRTPEGEWWIVSPGYYGWEHLGGSSQPLDALRFGDFNADRIADIIVENDKWLVSWSGRFKWEPLNEHVSTSLKNLLIADLDGNGIDDIIRYSTNGNVKGNWEVSWNGKSNWLTLATLTWPGVALIPWSSTVQGYVGRFSGSAASDLLSVDFTRRSKILWKSSTFNDFVAYGNFAY